jgi:hypothetical protein
VPHIAIKWILWIFWGDIMSLPAVIPKALP